MWRRHVSLRMHFTLFGGPLTFHHHQVKLSKMLLYEQIPKTNNTAIRFNCSLCLVLNDKKC